MTLHLHRAPRTDLLADALGELLAVPLEDPFADDVVVVPAKGVERWLTQRLSHRLGAAPNAGDGVCAGVRFPSPWSLRALLTGTERTDPWHPDRMAWPLLAVIDEVVADPPAWALPLAHHLGFGRTGEEAEVRRHRRWSVARRVAGLFGSYATQRPAVLRAWAEGLPEDGAGAALPPDLAWQPELWRRLLERIDAPSPQERHHATLEQLRAGAGELPLPSRLSLFGHTRISVTEAELVGALALHRDVHLWLPQPSPGLWERLREVAGEGPVRRRADTSEQVVQHPLLLALGRDTRELARTLAVAGPVVDEPVDVSAAPPSTLLGWLQADLLADAEPDAEARTSRVISPRDDTLQVHACHGTARQVEVLRETITELLERHPHLEPRDVLVMCPDIDAYAPLIQSAFGLGASDPGGSGTFEYVTATRHPAHLLRVRLADRGSAGTNPVLAVAMTLLELVAGRTTASGVLDLAARAPVRARFAFSDNDLEQVSQWVRQAEIRWGRNQESRAPFHMDAFAENTWRAGLDRILVGVAMAEHGAVVGTALPVDDVASTDIDLAGRLAELLERIDLAAAAFEQARTGPDWVSALLAAVDSLTWVAPADAWQRSQAEREIRGVAAGSENGADGTGLTLPDVRLLMAQRTGGRPTRSNFRTGSLTVCTMTPMRSVPHKVVCLLGLDDGVFPRSGGVDGDDVVARDPFTGERDVRSEDRQLFLDAVLAAREHLVITFSGFSEHTGAERPPSVPLGTLLDGLARTAAGDVVAHVRTDHPLQAFAEPNFAPEAPRSFDRAARAAALAARHPLPAPGFLAEPLPPVGGEVSIDDLASFVKNPARAFLRRLDVATPRDGDEIKDQMPIDLNGLEKWSVGDRLVRTILDGGDAEAALTAELYRGSLPPGGLGATTLRDICTFAQKLVDSTTRVRVAQPRTVEVAWPLEEVDGGRVLAGAVGHLHGQHLLRLTYSRLAAKHLMPAWIDLLALQVAEPEITYVAQVLGRGKRPGTIAHTLLGPVVPESAAEFLRHLVALRDAGLRTPWLVPLATGHAWAGESRTGLGYETDRAKKAWFTEDSSPVAGEQDDAAWVRLLGHKAPLAALGDFGTAADTLWYPLFDHAQEVAK